MTTPMMKTDLVSMYSAGEVSILRCPRCNSDYMHQEETVIFCRGEDDDDVFRVHEAGGKVEIATVPSRGSGNPSSRRQGLAIRMRCEGCSIDEDPDDRIELTIAQHKGNTEIAWRFTPMRRRPD